MVRMETSRTEIPRLSPLRATMRRMTKFRRPVIATLGAALIAAAAVVAAWFSHAPDREVQAAIGAERQAAAIEARDRAIVEAARIRDGETCDGIAVAAAWIDAAGHADMATAEGRNQAGRRYEAAMDRLVTSDPYNPAVTRAHAALRAAVVNVAYAPTAPGNRDTAVAAASMSAAACAAYAAGQH